MLFFPFDKAIINQIVFIKFSFETVNIYPGICYESLAVIIFNIMPDMIYQVSGIISGLLRDQITILRESYQSVQVLLVHCQYCQCNWQAMSRPN